MDELWPAVEGTTISYISRPPSEIWQREFPRSLVILGSTGSIGRNALRIVTANREAFQIVGLSCARNITSLAAQARQFRPPFLAVLDDEVAGGLKKLLPKNYSPTVFIGSKGYAQMASLPQATTVLAAQVGAAGLRGTVSAALAGKVICLANKESLVLAGHAVREICARTDATVLPVDSEHNALFQCVAGHGQTIRSLILTASGGPFFGKNVDSLRRVTKAQALNHPNWRMGAKISIDSATMMNKGLEIIEASHLYGVPAHNLRVLVHPQSVVHSLAELADGSLLALMGTADMRLPLAHCLLWPRCAQSGANRIDLTSVGALSFHEPDSATFPCLDLARRALESGTDICTVMNAANEAAVELFLNDACSFADIPLLTAKAMENYPENIRTNTTDTSADPAPATEAWLRHIEELDRASRVFVYSLAKSQSDQTGRNIVRINPQTAHSGE